MIGEDQKRRMKSYLLGQLSPEELADFEKRFYRDNDLFEQLVIAEDEMIRAYARGELAEPERTAFEASFLTTPERREKVQFEKALVEFSTHQARQNTRPVVTKAELIPRPQRFTMTRSWWVAVGATILLVATGTWLAVAIHGLHEHLQTAQADEKAREQEAQSLRQRISILERELQQAHAEISDRDQQIAELQSPVQQLPVALSPGVNRDIGRQQRVALPKNLSIVRLRLRLENDSNAQYQFFAAILETDQGRIVWKNEHLAAQKGRNGNSVVVSVPASLLIPGDYVLRLVGVTADANQHPAGIYVFRAIAR